MPTGHRKDGDECKKIISRVPIHSHRKNYSPLKRQRSKIMWDLLSIVIPLPPVMCTQNIPSAGPSIKENFCSDPIQIIFFPSTLFLRMRLSWGWWQCTSGAARGEWIWKLLWWTNVYIEVGHFLFVKSFIHVFIWMRKNLSHDDDDDEDAMVRLLFL